MNLKERILNSYLSELETERDILNLIKIREVDNVQMWSWLDTLWYCNQIFAFKALIVDEDITKVKYHFHVSGLLFEALARLSTIYSEGNIFMFSHNRLSYAMISDDPDLINRLTLLRGNANQRYIKEGSLLITMQCALREDWDALAQMIEIFDYRIDKCREKWRINDRDFFKGLINHEKGQMEQALYALTDIKSHNRRNIIDLYQEIISHPALGYAKLAWMKGFQVQINSSLIPLKLLPVQQENVYSVSYEFLSKITSSA